MLDVPLLGMLPEGQDQLVDSDPAPIEAEEVAEAIAAEGLATN